MQNKGITYLEVLCVLAIVATLTVVSMSPLKAALHRASIQSSLTRLKQLHVATMLYMQENEGGETEFSSLPTWEYVHATYYSQYGLNRDFFVSPCGYKEDIEPNAHKVSYVYGMDAVLNKPVIEKYGRNALLFTDCHCNASGLQFHSALAYKRGLGVTYSGKLVNLFKPGDVYNPSWWMTPE